MIRGDCSTHLPLLPAAESAATSAADRAREYTDTSSINPKKELV